MFPTPNGIHHPNFELSKFENLLQEKGVRVLIEKALQCPCKTQSHNNLSTCQNCGGTGYIFVNKKESIMALYSMPAKIDIEQFTMITKGTVAFSCRDDEHLAYMDKITRIDGRAIYNQVLELKTKGGIHFCKSVYEIKNIQYIGFYTGDTTVLRQLSETEYTIDRNFIKLTDTAVLPDTDVITLTIRYEHAPVFHVQDFTREDMDNWKIDNLGAKLQRLPIAGMAKKAEYVFGQTDMEGYGILDNSYEEHNCKKDTCI